MQIMFSILDEEIDKHLFQPGRIFRVDEKGATIFQCFNTKTVATECQRLAKDLSFAE
jgi:hypothetical protein